jgi:hypothetical protein
MDHPKKGAPGRSAIYGVVLGGVLGMASLAQAGHVLTVVAASSRSPSHHHSAKMASASLSLPTWPKASWASRSKAFLMGTGGTGTHLCS